MTTSPLGRRKQQMLRSVPSLHLMMVLLNPDPAWVTLLHEHRDGWAAALGRDRVWVTPMREQLVAAPKKGAAYREGVSLALVRAHVRALPVETKRHLSEARARLNRHQGSYRRFMPTAAQGTAEFRRQYDTWHAYEKRFWDERRDIEAARGPVLDEALPLSGPVDEPEDLFDLLEGMP